MKKLILSTAILLAAIVTSCTDNHIESQSQQEIIKSEADNAGNSFVRKAIDANNAKQNLVSSARSSGGATWYFTPYGYQMTGSVTSYSKAVSAYISNTNSFPIIVAVTGQLRINSPSLNCSGGGTCMWDDSPGYTNPFGYGGGRVILGPGVSATLNFTAEMRSTSSVEGWLWIEHIAPTNIANNQTDDFIYLIRGV
jgi:hypothetical protein